MQPFHWEMFEGADPRDAYRFDDDYRKVRLAQEELNTAVYPYADWILVLHTDERGFNDELHKLYSAFSNAIKERYNKDINKSWTCDHLTLDRYEYFDKTATLGEVMARIAGGVCHGTLHGFRRTDEYVPGNYQHRKPVFHINHST